MRIDGGKPTCRFQGSSEEMSMLSVIPSHLSGRRFPEEAPKGGKGTRITEAHGVAAVAQVPLLRAVEGSRTRRLS